MSTTSTSGAADRARRRVKRMVVRRATVDDASAIATIHVTSWQAGYQGIVPEPFLRSLSVEAREARWREILQQEASVTYVVEDPRHIAGWISVGRSRDPEVVPTTGELWAIYVAPADWGRGAGRALWDRGRAHLSESGFLDVTVWVLKDNRRALRFYEAAGFARDGQERPIEIGGASLPEIRLGCSLDAQRTVSR